MITSIQSSDNPCSYINKHKSFILFKYYVKLLRYEIYDLTNCNQQVAGSPGIQKMTYRFKAQKSRAAPMSKRGRPVLNAKKSGPGRPKEDPPKPFILAGDQNRTGDLRTTNATHYRLCYASELRYNITTRSPLSIMIRQKPEYPPVHFVILFHIAVICITVRAAAYIYPPDLAFIKQYAQV